MAKGGKILALIGGILVLLGTFGLSLYTAGGMHYYGIGYFIPFTNFTGLFAGGIVPILIAVGIILYLLAFVLIFIGIKVKILALIGSLFPLAMATFVFLFTFGVWPTAFGMLYGTGFAPLLAPYVPLSFSQTILFGGLDLGTWAIAVGGLFAFISGFLPRDDY